MATWVVGDVHGCAAELERLLDELAPGRGDRVVLLGDLFHRGPDPSGVLALVRASGARFVLGNHEHVLLARLAGREAAGPFSAADLRGDSDRPLELDPARADELLALVRSDGAYFLESGTLAGAGPTRDGRSWCAVHAGITPGRTARESRVEDLVYPARVSRGAGERGRRAPFWYEHHGGPELVLFGHLVFEEPRVVERDERKVAIGLDTGALYGGRLTAYSPELDEFRSVNAARAYVQRS